MNKKSLILVGVLLLTLLLSACSSNGDKKGIYNDNSKIIKEGDSYTYKERKGETTENGCNIEFSSFSGMETIWSIEALKEDKITINFNSKVNKGDFKLVLITTDNEVINILENTQEGNSEVTIKEGKSRIKFVGKATSGSCEISILSKDEDIKIAAVDNSLK